MVCAAYVCSARVQCWRSWTWYYDSSGNCRIPPFPILPRQTGRLPYFLFALVSCSQAFSYEHEAAPAHSRVIHHIFASSVVIDAACVRVVKCAADEMGSHVRVLSVCMRISHLLRARPVANYHLHWARSRWTEGIMGVLGLPCFVGSISYLVVLSRYYTYLVCSCAHRDIFLWLRYSEIERPINPIRLGALKKVWPTALQSADCCTTEAQSPDVRG